MKNCFYFQHINKIGGIEAFFYYLAKKYKDWDITIYYRTGDYKQIARLKKLVRVIEYKGQKIKCDKMFFNFNLDIIDNVEANEYIQIAHGDYKAMKIKPNTHPKLTKYLGVSQQVCDTYEEVTGNKTHLVYNPIEIEKPKKMLNLISATRLTREKGKNRMIKLAKMLDDAKIPYLWLIFTDDKQAILNSNIVYMKPRLDITNYIANADYLVQLSDNEGYCYSVIESLLCKTPVLVTDCPVFKELGVKDGENGFIFDFELSNVDIEKIYKGLPRFEYTPKEDNWSDILAKGKSSYKEEKEMKVKVKTIIKFLDMESGKDRKPGEEFECTQERADYLVQHNAVKVIGVVAEEKVEEPKNEEHKVVEVIKPKKEVKKTTTKPKPKTTKKTSKK